MSEPIRITPFSLAQRFVGLREARGPIHNAHVLAMLQLDNTWVRDDETAWCSAFVNYVAWLLRLPRSKSLAARSWLKVGVPIFPIQAEPGFDVVILKRGQGEQPGPEVLAAPGHVGFFGGWNSDATLVYVLGGNQDDEVSVAEYPADRILGIRRLAA